MHTHRFLRAPPPPNTNKSHRVGLGLVVTLGQTVLDPDFDVQKLVTTIDHTLISHKILAPQCSCNASWFQDEIGAHMTWV